MHKPKVFVAISKSQVKKYEKELNAIAFILKSLKYKPEVFARDNALENYLSKKIMNEATKAISNSTLLIIEATNESIGIGIEAGYAFANGKPIFYLRKIGYSPSTTLKGIASSEIVYKNVKDLKKQLSSVLKRYISLKSTNFKT